MRRLPKEDAQDRIAAERLVLPASAAGCPLCALVTTPPHHDDLAVLRSNDKAVAVLARYALRPGHTLVVLRQHAEHLDELPWADYAALHRLGWEVARALRQVQGPRRIFVAALEGPEALLDGPLHLHLHVVPLVDSDERDRPSRLFSYQDGVLIYDPGEAEALAAALRDAPAEPP